jgi:hypothetical protein
MDAMTIEVQEYFGSGGQPQDKFLSLDQNWGVLDVFVISV